MTDPFHDQTGRASLDGARGLAAARIGIGLVQGLLLYLLWRSVSPSDALTWPATNPPLFAALVLTCAFTPVMLLAGVGRLSVKALARTRAANSGGLVAGQVRASCVAMLRYRP